MFSQKDAKRIKFLRKKAGLTARFVAKELLYEMGSYCYIELGKVVPREEDLCKISQYYGVSAEWLMTGIATNDYETQLNEELAAKEKEEAETLRSSGKE